MQLSEIRKALDDRNVSEVSRRLYVSRTYLQGIRSGKVKKISENMRKRLTEYLSSDYLK